jgi:coenzyme Q-binding protein COQ10
LPWVESLQTSEYLQTDSITEFKADVRIGFKLFSESFSTRVTINSEPISTKPAQVAINLIKGPFRSLMGKWSIQPLSETKCQVSLELRLEFSNPILGAVFMANQERIAQKIIGLFSNRAMIINKKSHQY